MNAERWWTRVSFSLLTSETHSATGPLLTAYQIIHNTFTPLIGPDQQIHSELAPRLIYRFSSEEGYRLYPDVVPLIRRLRGKPGPNAPRVVIGIITNSDDRVPSVLSSLGLSVSPFRYGLQVPQEQQAGQQYDVDFTVLSYDVGHEKPDRRIFAAAEDMLMKNPMAVGTDTADWDKVYIGDDVEKDVGGALNAGWKAILVDRESAGGGKQVFWQDRLTLSTLSSAFEEANGQALGFDSLAALARLLPENS